MPFENSEKEKSEKFSAQTVTVLNEHSSRLDALETGVMEAAKRPGSAVDVAEVLKAVGNALADCKQTTEFYDEEDPMPEAVKGALANTQQACIDAVSALVALGLIRKMQS